jgi:hypothetical protein
MPVLMHVSLRLARRHHRSRAATGSPWKVASETEKRHSAEAQAISIPAHSTLWIGVANHSKLGEQFDIWIFWASHSGVRGPNS